MQRQTFLKLSAYLGTGIILGLIFGQTSIFGIMPLMGLAAISYFVVFVLLIVSGLRRQMPTWTFVFGFISFSLTVSVFVAFMTLRFKRDQRQERADELILKIEQHKKSKGKYPRTLTLLQNAEPKDLETFYYSLDTTQNKYEMSFSIDGWHQMRWTSESKEWESRD